MLDFFPHSKQQVDSDNCQKFQVCLGHLIKYFFTIVLLTFFLWVFQIINSHSHIVIACIKSRLKYSSVNHPMKVCRMLENKITWLNERKKIASRRAENTRNLSSTSTSLNRNIPELRLRDYVTALIKYSSNEITKFARLLTLASTEHCNFSAVQRSWAIMFKGEKLST